MFFLQYRIIPATDHPRREQLGEGLACCWLERPSLAAADKFARKAIAKENWKIIEREHGFSCSEDDFEDHLLPYYEQALIDKEVFVYNQSPRYPAYHVVAAVEQGLPASVAEAHYFLCGDSIRQDGEDVYDPDFWSGERKQTALDGAKEAIIEAGWTITQVLHNGPCGPGDLPEDLLPFYDEAEEEGVCLVFVTDDPLAENPTG
jgi:hypothetical protein